MIFNEKFDRAKEATLSGLNLKYDEKSKGLKGEYHIVLQDAKTGEVVDERVGRNLIVKTASILIARLLKDPQEPLGGITYLAVGTGASGWNLQNPPQPVVTQTALFSELTRKAFTTPDVTFIDPDTGNPTAIPTSVLDFTMTFKETEAVGPIVEMGLFGGDANSIINSGTMVNHRTFPVLNKLSSMVLTITFRITA